MIPLPAIYELKRLAQSLATLDLILSPEWAYRYYSYNSQWSESQKMASMRNGCGDDWFILFDDSGYAAIKGLAHESPAATEKDFVAAIQSALPRELEEFATEPAFHWKSTSYCFWRMANSKQWMQAPEQETIETGAKEYLSIFTDTRTHYHQFAEENYEQEIDPTVIDHIIAHHPLNEAIVNSLNPGVSLEDLTESLAEIGYPH